MSFPAPTSELQGKWNTPLVLQVVKCASVFLVQDMSIVINYSGCAFIAADCHRVEVPQGNHSFSCSILQSALFAWDPVMLMWCDQPALTLRLIKAVDDHSFPLHRNFLPNLVKNNSEECGLCATTVCVIYLGFFVLVLAPQFPFEAAAKANNGRRNSRWKCPYSYTHVQMTVTKIRQTGSGACDWRQF